MVHHQFSDYEHIMDYDCKPYWLLNYFMRHSLALKCLLIKHILGKKCSQSNLFHTFNLKVCSYWKLRANIQYQSYPKIYLDRKKLFFRKLYWYFLKAYNMSVQMMPPHDELKVLKMWDRRAHRRWHRVHLAPEDRICWQRCKHHWRTPWASPPDQSGTCTESLCLYSSSLLNVLDAKYWIWSTNLDPLGNSRQHLKKRQIQFFGHVSTNIFKVCNRQSYFAKM